MKGRERQRGKRKRWCLKKANLLEKKNATGCKDLTPYNAVIRIYGNDKEKIVLS